MIEKSIDHPLDGRKNPLSSRYFGLIPAAGSGARFASGHAGGALPKQYQSIAGAPMLVHAAKALLAAPEIEIVFVVLSPGDARFRDLDLSAFGKRIEPLYCGGNSRRDSVLNGLIAIANVADPDDWVLVHDAARPCLGAAELQRLVAGAGEDGALLAVPVADTLKRADANGFILATEPREDLWQAQTPQMFRYAPLLRALRESPAVTDEAGAMENMGVKPKLVAGSPTNIKVTLAADLALAQLILASKDPE